ncbi:hypothetical protein M0802_010869 [Mischocyttarus mexicanus]|nr:hypothetical protein M0802_010869 [Mischocyttarus mexicanus]
MVVGGEEEKERFGGRLKGNPVGNGSSGGGGGGSSSSVFYGEPLLSHPPHSSLISPGSCNNGTLEDFKGNISHWLDPSNNLIPLRCRRSPRFDSMPRASPSSRPVPNNLAALGKPLGASGDDCRPEAPREAGRCFVATQSDDPRSGARQSTIKQSATLRSVLAMAAVAKHTQPLGAFSLFVKQTNSYVFPSGKESSLRTDQNEEGLEKGSENENEEEEEEEKEEEVEGGRDEDREAIVTKFLLGSILRVPAMASVSAASKLSG